MRGRVESGDESTSAEIEAEARRWLWKVSTSEVGCTDDRTRLRVPVAALWYPDG
jgi:hypothetical protein